MRELSKAFMDDLSKPEGKLHPILTRVKKDQTLMLAIRDGFIQIYYRGGNILKVTESGNGFYKPFFDNRYNKSGEVTPNSPTTIKSQNDTKIWVDSFLWLKYMMDDYLSKYGKSEREFQQLVARENNNSPISNESEYFISDIEVYESETGGRFDMSAIRWLATQHKSGKNCQPAFFEMKYGDGALGGKAGLLKHLRDFDTLFANKEGYSKMLHVIENQFNQLDQLELLKFNKGQNYDKVELVTDAPPELIFILANHNPRSSELKTILDSPEVLAYVESLRFNLKFFIASFSGYGLHSKCMHNIVEFRKLL